MTNLEIGEILLASFVVLYLLKKLPTVRALAAFIGTFLVFHEGHVGRIIGDGAVWLAHVSGTVTAWAFGGAVIAIPAIISGILFIHDLMPKHAAKNRTGWAAIVFAALIAAGATGIPALAGVGNAVNNGVNTVKQIGN